jgi:hypothetical protein
MVSRSRAPFMESSVQRDEPGEIDLTEVYGEPDVCHLYSVQPSRQNARRLDTENNYGCEWLR